MPNYKKVTRDLIATYLNTTPKVESENWGIVGVGITDYGQDYNGQVTTTKWIIHKNSISELDGYQIQGDVSQTCYHGDAVYDFINDLRRGAKIGDEVKTQILDVDMYDATGEGAEAVYKATKYECIVVIKSYAKGETPAIEYTIYYNGDPILGTVKFADGKLNFTETV